jgi:hypothetical protein
MRTALLVSAVLMGAVAGSAYAAAPASSGDEITLFNYQNFQGPTVRLTGDSPNLNVFGVNSIRTGGQTWKICSQPNFAGRCVTVTGEDGHFAARGLPGVRSAVRLDRVNGPGAVPSEIVFFNYQNFQGPNDRFTGDMPNVQLPWGVNSVRVNGEVWELCAKPDYAGTCTVVSADNGHFASVGLKSVRSIRRMDKVGGASGPSATTYHPAGSGGQGPGQGTGSGQSGQHSGQGSGQSGGQSGQGGWQGGQGTHHHGAGGGYGQGGN